MKTNITSNWKPLLRVVYAFIIAITALWVVPRNACAQLYVTKPLLPPGLLGVVSKYRTDGTVFPPNGAKFIAGVNFPEALALNGNTLFVANGGDNTVSAYTANTDTATPAPHFTTITGLKQPAGLAVLGDTLFVANSRAGTVGTYKAKTGDEINASFIKGLSGPAGLAVLGNTLFVANSGAGTVSAYTVNTDTGAPAPGFTTITGLTAPVGLAVLGDWLFVANSGAGTVGKYTARTGGPINASFIKGLNSPVGLAVLGDTTLFVTSSGAGTVGTYSAGGNVGTAITPNLVTGLLAPAGIAVQSNNSD
jgi:DNA-binding beta-propeller fold protein YncE